MMVTLLSQTILVGMLARFFAGVLCYIWDRKTGVKLYRKYYDKSHKDPLPAGTEMGYIYNRSTKMKLKRAAWLSVFVSGFSLLYGVNFLTEFLHWLSGIVVIFLGFLVGKFWVHCKGSDKALAFAEKIDHADIHPVKDITEGASKIVHNITEKPKEVMHSVVGIFSKKEDEKKPLNNKAQSIEQKKVNKNEEIEKAQKAIDNYVK